MVSSTMRKRKQSHHASVGNKRTNAQSQPSSTTNRIQHNNTTFNQQVKTISVTSSTECSELTDMTVNNQQNLQKILDMETELAKLKQQNATLQAQQQLQQQQQEQQQQQQQQQEQQTQIVTSVKKHRHRVKKPLSYMDWKIKFITKNYIFSKVKFITDESQLEDHKKKSSIGYLFLQVMQQNHKEPIDDVEVFWNSAKKMVYSAINEKRNSVQNAIKKAWMRMYYVCIFII